MDETRACSCCGEMKPFVEFGKDARRPDGLRSECKYCLRVKQRDRRRRTDKPKPGALVLVPKFPAPPPTLVPDEPARPAPRVDTYADAAEKVIAALDPPAGPADELLVRSLRGLADLADRYSYGPDVVKDVNSIVASMVRVQRELAATRAARAKEQTSDAAPKGKLGRFSA